jgi:hypothetical protein
MYKSIVLSIFCCAIFSYADAQTLTMPPGIAQAYSNNTRSTSGKPGKKYWENHGRYTISVSIAPPNRMINGVEEITYFNNSPDTLRSLNIKLIENVHNIAARSGAADTAAGVTVNDIKINGTKVAWNNKEATTTNQMVSLLSPLMPHDSVKLNISWHYQLSLRHGREGVLDSTSFYLAYFYPRVSVYDDYKGWDTQPHTGSLEFYND